MLFLLNDTVLQLEGDLLAEAKAKTLVAPLRFDFVTRMGQELFSEDPLVHKQRPERARRLASLIVTKAPTINAALFIATARGCPIEQVQFRYAQVDFEVLCGLSKRQSDGALSTVDADRQVWKRLAA
jgi:hypothetical protein